ncbi:BnaA02g16790D [Brassica napus]|uniref:BnaA02g16790D protein n=1 Tax=Brassica napus TaxID=3708 RepID=A0A078IGM3_BRANA|nr:BnaA02g16790D [Brassica napus]
MNISNNDFEGNLPASLGNMRSMEHLDISHNGFHGNLPDSLRSFKELVLLDISDNNLTGVIPSWIGEFQHLSMLLLSNNLLEGEIPISLFNLSYLGLLDLSANMLSGDIPPHVNSERRVVLLLHDNNFSKGIPDTLLLNVSILDMRNNRLSGNIPEFINTQNISILLLRGNNFTGRIPHQLCGLSNIHLLDLANNGLSGSIPSCLSNISFGSGKEDTSNDFDFVYGIFNGNDVGAYFRSLVVLEQFSMDYLASFLTKIEFPTKHRYDSYMGGNLLELCGLDLSQNKLSGEIPVEIGGDLLKLHALNLSHNYLSGEIPRSFSGLKTVESLDLSFNRLHGEIPPQLSELSSLGVFKVSYNNLSGVIPQGGHLSTFDANSYVGNPFLCGKPTNKSCNSNNIQEPDDEVEDDEYTIDMVSFYWSLAAAYVTILLGVIASLSFDSPWSRAWFNLVDAFLRKVRYLFWC